jgi:hypothetical protein
LWALVEGETLTVELLLFTLNQQLEEVPVETLLEVEHRMEITELREEEEPLVEIPEVPEL